VLCDEFVQLFKNTLLVPFSMKGKVFAATASNSVLEVSKGDRTYVAAFASKSQWAMIIDIGIFQQFAAVFLEALSNEVNRMPSAFTLLLVTASASGAAKKIIQTHLGNSPANASESHGRFVVLVVVLAKFAAFVLKQLPTNFDIVPASHLISESSSIDM